MLGALPHLELVTGRKVAVDEVEAEVAERLLLHRELVLLELEGLPALMAEGTARVQLGALTVCRVPPVRGATVLRQNLDHTPFSTIS